MTLFNVLGHERRESPISGIHRKLPVYVRLCYHFVQTGYVSAQLRFFTRCKRPVVSQYVPALHGQDEPVG